MRCQLRAILSEGSSDHDYRVRHNHHTSKHSMSTTSLMSPQQRPHLAVATADALMTWLVRRLIEATSRNPTSCKVKECLEARHEARS